MININNNSTNNIKLKLNNSNNNISNINIKDLNKIKDLSNRNFNSNKNVEELDLSVIKNKNDKSNFDFNNIDNYIDYFRNKKIDNILSETKKGDISSISNINNDNIKLFGTNTTLDINGNEMDYSKRSLSNGNYYYYDSNGNVIKTIYADGSVSFYYSKNISTGVIIDDRNNSGGYRDYSYNEIFCDINGEIKYKDSTNWEFQMLNDGSILTCSGDDYTIVKQDDTGTVYENYNENGNLTNISFANGISLSASYDMNNDISNIYEKNNNEKINSIVEFNDDGNISYKATSETTAIEYDNNGNIISNIVIDGNITTHYNLDGTKYSYNSDNNTITNYNLDGTIQITNLN